MAEALAAKFGLDRCIQHGVHNISLELDSMLITNLIKQGHSSNIFLKPIIDDIKEMVKDANMEVSHCYRESNQVADGLSKFATTLNEPKFINQYHDLPQDSKGLITLTNGKCRVSGYAMTKQISSSANLNAPFSFMGEYFCYAYGKRAFALRISHFFVYHNTLCVVEARLTSPSIYVLAFQVINIFPLKKKNIIFIISRLENFWKNPWPIILSKSDADIFNNLRFVNLCIPIGRQRNRVLSQSSNCKLQRLPISGNSFNSLQFCSIRDRS
ncbi:hypothetical protein MTR67_013134 [Solanum verrucosum]|uniref:RNase H type-1 domain-containing protein n=1 Tax=Solanum verrucosum TaxID=315347 RepID=A0AAF0TI47_SOLVR|nr:hypothetical protein MTR67_013134 [Solanum verrucosum]